MIIFRRTTILPVLLLITSIFVSSSECALGANSGSNRISRDEYIHRYKHIAIAHQQRYGIPASITMAQGILESAHGNSNLARKSNNHFGIKCKDEWTGRFVTHTDDAPNECFRAYDSVEESYEDHAIFLDSSPRYDSLFAFKPTDYRSWARGLKGAGYATAPDYAIRLVQLIEDYNLHDLDAEAESGRASFVATNQSVEGADKETSHLVYSYQGVDPNNYRVAINAVNGYNIYRSNQTYYVVAKEGDNYTAIGSMFDISAKSLRKYNERDIEPRTGEIVYIGRKQTKWLGNIHHHTVLEGETLYSISQSYAIRESSLRRLNRLKKGENPAVGLSLRLK